MRVYFHIVFLSKNKYCLYFKPCENYPVFLLKNHVLRKTAHKSKYPLRIQSSLDFRAMYLNYSFNVEDEI